MKVFYLTVLIFISVICSYSQSNSWNGIRPLHSNRADVEKLLGKPDITENGYARYEKQGVAFEYIKKRCQEGWDTAAGWDVLVSTILKIYIYQKRDDFGKLPEVDKDLTTKNFVRMPYSYEPITWINPKEGVEIVVGDDYAAKVYIPREADNNLRCNGYAPFAPTRYSEPHNFNLKLYDPKRDSREVFSELIANFEILLYEVRKDTNKKARGYVLLYFDNELSLTQYRRIIIRVENILKRRHSLLPNEITFVEAGLREYNEAQPFLIPEGANIPAPHPTLPSPQFMRKAK